MTVDTIIESIDAMTWKKMEEDNDQTTIKNYVN